jgi:hypothetical protein
VRQLLQASSALALVLGLVLTSSVQAQVQPKDNKVQPAKDDGDSGRIHTMVIQNGTARSVHFFTNSTSPSEQRAVRDLERAEAEATYADSLLALRQQYVNDEKLLEPRRSQMQQWYYGTSTNKSQSDSYGGGYGWGGYGMGGWGAYGYGWGGLGGYGSYGPSYGMSSSSSVSNGLGEGIGREGAIKAAMAPIIAGQANPQYASNAWQNANAVAVATLGKRGTGTVGLVNEQRVEAKKRAITAILKDGSKVEGTSFREDGQWLTVIKADGESMIPRADVTRIEVKFTK